LCANVVAHNVYVNVLSNFHIHQVLGTVHLTCRGGYGFLLRLEIFFRTTRELELFFCRAKRAIFFPEFNIRLYDKNSESDFFFPPPKSEYFFQIIHSRIHYVLLELRNNEVDNEVIMPEVKNNQPLPHNIIKLYCITS
jgi:hypothetical protein